MTKSPSLILRSLPSGESSCSIVFTSSQISLTKFSIYNSCIVMDVDHSFDFYFKINYWIFHCKYVADHCQKLNTFCCRTLKLRPTGNKRAAQHTYRSQPLHTLQTSRLNIGATYIIHLQSLSVKKRALVLIHCTRSLD